jgi:glutathione S-transferase
VHPLGKSPVITDGEITVAESGAIIEYLLDTYGNGRLRPPAGTAQRRQFTYWLHFAEGSAMPFLVMKLVFDKVRTAPVPFFVKPVVKGIAAKVGQELHRTQHRPAVAPYGDRTLAAPLVCWRRIQRGGCADELLRGSRRRARRAGQPAPITQRLAGAHPRTAGVPAGLAGGWAVQRGAMIRRATRATLESGDLDSARVRYLA